MWSYKILFTISVTIKLLFVSYGQIQDNLFDVKYTDIDYHVFVGGSRFIFNGSSPYDRHTYRYSPILAWLTLPSIFYFEFGKILFCFFDLLNSYLILRLVRNSNVEAIATFVCLFNPFTMIISSRGNAESVTSFTVLLTLLHLKQNRQVLAAIVHGFAIHLKIYPIIYLPAVYFHLTPKNGKFSRFLLNFKGIVYVLVTLTTFFLINTICYHFYGEKFLSEALLYHMKRTDVKHNFSPYFYPLYLSMREYPGLHNLLSKIAFLPQLFCILLFAFKYNTDLEYCFFITTFCFVAFNKVCTSQYFVWYLTFLPLLFGKLRFGVEDIVVNASLWVIAQAFWLFFAYLLEFRGYNVFIHVWFCSILLLFVNVYLIRRFNSAYRLQNSKTLKTD